MTDSEEVKAKKAEVQEKITELLREWQRFENEVRSLGLMRAGTLHVERAYMDPEDED